MGVLASWFNLPTDYKPAPYKKEWKPKFTEKELVHARTLSKRERKKYLAVLREDRLAEAGGARVVYDLGTEETF